MDVPVVVKRDGRLVGRVKNVYFDKIVRNFVYFGIETAEGGRLFLPVGAATPKQALLLDDAALATLKEDVDVSALSASLLGLAAYTLSGDKKGVVLDAKFSNEGELNRLILSDGDIPPSQISCIGDVVLVKCARTSARVPRPKKDYPVQILKKGSPANSETENGGAPVSCDELQDVSSLQPDMPQLQATSRDADRSRAAASQGANFPPQNDNASERDDKASSAFGAVPAYGTVPPKPAVALGKGEPLFSQGALNAVLDGDAYFSDHDSHNPTRIICDYEFLLGRTLGADLLTYTGDLLAPKGAIITANIVELARAHGKLVDLTLNSVKQKH